MRFRSSGRSRALKGPPPPVIGAAPLAPLGSTWSMGQHIHGIAGGAQLGYNYQFNPWLVLGAEADIQATDAVSHSRSTLGGSTPPEATCRA